MNFFENSVFFGVTISLIAYGFGHALQGKFKLAILNPLLISVASIIALLAVTHIDYKAYYSGAQYLSYLLTPATVCLAIPLYEQFELLKKNLAAVICGIFSGVSVSYTHLDVYKRQVIDSFLLISCLLIPVTFQKFCRNSP